MRNIFDQYTQPENRVTHALVCALHEDRKLLWEFVKWVTGKTPPPRKSLTIVEQRLPGEVEIAEDEFERRGLPDAWIHDDGTWSLIIESKVTADLKNDQLRRHKNTAMRRGFEDITLLAIDVKKPKIKLLDGALFCQWSEVYEWLIKKSDRSEWAGRTAEYLEVAELKLSEDGYLQEGTLTTFTGIPFGIDNPYNYAEAKRLLKLMLEDLRSRKELIKKLGMDPTLPGRGAITGKKSMAIWDFLKLKVSSNENDFTKFPHLTLFLNHEQIGAAITIPHRIKNEFRKNITSLGYEQFYSMISKVNSNLCGKFKKIEGAHPWVNMIQRHYPSLRSPAIVDANLQFDLRTAFNQKNSAKHKVKQQEQWLKTVFDALSNKKSNLQVAIGAKFVYANCKIVNKPIILDYMAASWIACKPILDVMLRNSK